MLPSANIGPRLPVGISGAGCVCAAGVGLKEIERSLRTGRSGIEPVRLFSVESFRSRSAGQVPVDVAEAAAAIHAPAREWSRAGGLFLMAAHEALEARPGFQPDMIIIGTTSGGMDLGERFFRASTERGDRHEATRKVRGYPPTVAVLDAVSALGIAAPVRIVSNACASGTNAIGMAWQLVCSGRAKRVLAGGYDALSELVFAGFDCLQASTTTVCRPFDRDRDGLVLGEGAAVFCIENEGDTRISGYGAATDTHHLTQPHPSGIGPRTAMQRALESATLTSVDYINAHGTATTQNDACEARALQDLCPSSPVSSTKAATGHTLGAAGAIEAAFCHIALHGGFLPPNLNFHQADEGVHLDIVTHPRQAVLRRVMSNSFGFGGSNASLILELP